MRLRAMVLALAVVGMLGSSHGIASAAPAASADPPTADTTKFLLAGIRPHMTEAQAHAVLARIVDAPADKLLGSEQVSCASDYIAALKMRNPQSAPTRCTSELTAVVGDALVSVFLIEDFPAHPGSMVVFAVGYVQTGLMPTTADDATIATRLRQRFGPPDAEAANGSEFWGPNAFEYQSLGIEKDAIDHVGVDSDGTWSPTVALPQLGKAGQVDFAVGFDASSVFMLLSDHRFAESRTEAIRAAYNATVLPPLKTSF